MDNGTIWGHGAYLGPDYSAEALHRIGERHRRGAGAAAIRQAAGRDLTPRHNRPALRSRSGGGAEDQPLRRGQRHAASDRAGSRGLSPADRPLDATTSTIRSSNGGLKPDLITDPAELHQLTAFITWAAWASVANRPGADYSYTNNFPYDPDCRQSSDCRARCCGAR